MTSLVVSSLTQSSGEIELGECIRRDVRLNQTKIPILRFFLRRRERWFYVLGNGVARPNELDDDDYRYIRESMIHLPASKETLQKFERTFKLLAEDFYFSKPVIRYCHNGGVIIYCAKPLR